MALVAKSDFSVVITGGKIRIPGEWTERTGGEKQREVSNQFEGATTPPP